MNNTDSYRDNELRVHNPDYIIKEITANCKECNKPIGSHSAVKLHEHLKKIPSKLNVDETECPVCVCKMNKHTKKNIAECLVLASSGSFAGMKKFCGDCKYKTIVIPVNHSKCSGCGKKYKVIPSQIIPNHTEREANQKGIDDLYG